MIALHRKYGRLVRTGPNEVSVSDPAAIKTIYAPGSKFKKSEWYGVWQGHRAFDLFAERNERKHGMQRRLVSNIYSTDSLLQSESHIDRCLKDFLGKLRQRVSQPINLGLWLQLFAFDIVGEVTFSQRFGFIDAAKDDGAFQQIEKALKSAAWVGQIHQLYWILDFLSPVIGSGWLAISARHGKLRAFAAQQVARRKDRSNDNLDILSKLRDVQVQKPQELDENAVLSMATSNIFAGSDTTAISLRAIIFHLLKNPRYKQRVIEEVDEMEKEGKVSDPIKYAEAKEMPYLQACIHEGLRLHPATVIGVNPWVIHRDTSIFGEDVDSFKPERWLGHRTSDMGAYTCTRT
ncbi:MAG: hypothetical protein Q9220_007372 [cf. Caloplaca sp. 1 TL-2023]